MAIQNEADMTEEERRELQDRRERMLATVMSTSTAGRPMEDMVAEAAKALTYIQEGKTNG